MPAYLAAISGPRVGFIGGLDAHTFVPELFLEVARRLAGHKFVLVGGSSLPEDWCDLANVRILGCKPYEEVAAYQAAMDVLVMPWNDSEWIKACNPIKLKEYLAVGRPIVTTDFAALERCGTSCAWPRARSRWRRRSRRQRASASTRVKV